jgi:hypothetical protein
MGTEDGLREDPGLSRLWLQHPPRDPKTGAGRRDHGDGASRAVRQAEHFKLYAVEGMQGVVDDDPISCETGILTGL